MKTILPILFAALLCGCASYGHKLDPTQIQKIKKGVSTQAEVVALVGSPDQTLSTGDGKTIFEYIYAHSSVNGATYVPVVGLFAGGAATQSQMLLVTFGPDGLVSDMMSSSGASQVNLGH